MSSVRQSPAHTSPEEEVLPLRHEISDAEYNEYSPEAKARIMLRTRQNAQRIIDERAKDAVRESIEKAKLKKEVSTHPEYRSQQESRILTKEDKERERLEVEKWLSQNPPVGIETGVSGVKTEQRPPPIRKKRPTTRKKAPKISDEEIDRMLADPATWGPDVPKEMFEEPGMCMNQVNDEQCGNPATHLLVHNGMLGDLPPVELCERCAKNISVIERKPLHSKKSISMRLKYIANSLDKSGFYDEADVIDSIIKEGYK